MKAFAAWAMKGRMQAVIAATVLAVLLSVTAPAAAFTLGGSLRSFEEERQIAKDALIFDARYNNGGFIQAARDESIGVLRELAANKRADQLLIAAGCLSQRYVLSFQTAVAGLRSSNDLIELTADCWTSLEKGKKSNLPFP